VAVDEGIGEPSASGPKELGLTRRLRLLTRN